MAQTTDPGRKEAPGKRSNSMLMHVHANAVREVKEGLYEIAIPARILDREESQALHRLFPTLTTQAFELLDKQALLDSIIPPHMVASLLRDE